MAIPTETVYGLAADAGQSEAVQRIFDAKGRPQDNPLIVHISSMDALPAVVSSFPIAAQRLAEAFWPGPLTLVLPKAEGLAPQVSAGLATVGVRMPSHPVARAVIEAAGLPLAAPSANRSGSPSPTTAAHVLADLEGRIPVVLDGGPCRVGLESTVVSMVGTPTVLRPGFVTQAALEQALQQPVLLDKAVTAPLDAGAPAASPGVKYRHYAPKAQVTLVEAGEDAFADFVRQHAAAGVMALCFEEELKNMAVPSVSYGTRNSEEEQAVMLFGALRALDEHGATIVYAHAPHREGIGLAVLNRLLRAAAFRVIVL